MNNKTHTLKHRTKYRCLFNHELLIAVISETPYQTYKDNVTIKQIENLVYELKSTDIDLILCCPTGWKMPLYKSAVDEKWGKDLLKGPEPLPEADWKFHEKAYWRARRMILGGIDPVAITISAAHKIGRDIFASYRMNDHHYNMTPDCPTHSRFWREHPEYYIRPENTSGSVETSASSVFGYSCPSNLDYSHDQVRSHFRRILEELMERYPWDGLELDFMRTPPYFAPNRVESGAPLLTEFVRAIRKMLDGVGRRRRKHLPLCVRVPRSLAHCAALGLDVQSWGREGLIDMVNISSFYMNAHNLSIEEFKRTLPMCDAYGEMHFVYEPGVIPWSNYNNNISRKTPDALYRSTALSILDRGADGVSLFNFDYVREHSFREPRRGAYPGVEPHFDVLAGITDKRRLENTDKLYHFGFAYDGLPMNLASRESGTIEVYIGDHPEKPRSGWDCILRLETAQPAFSSLEVTVNGKPAAMRPDYTGELTKPLSLEALPRLEQLVYFDAPKKSLRHGWNTLGFTNTSTKQYNRGDVTIRNVQIALKHGAV